MKISVEYASPRHPDIKKLLLASHQLMRDLYPEETNSYLSIDELCSSDVHFLGARQNDKYCGCGALEVKSDYGELKSFFVEPQLSFLSSNLKALSPYLTFVDTSWIMYGFQKDMS